MRILCVKATGLWKDKLLLASNAELREIPAPHNTLRLEALRAAAKEPDGAWVEPALELLQGLKRPEDAGDTGQYQVSMEEDDEERLRTVIEMIREAAGLQRVQMALAFRLALAHYQLKLKKAGGVLRAVKAIGEGDIGIDVIAFWLAYEKMVDDQPGKMEELRTLCREILNRNESLYAKLREEGTKQVRGLSDGYGPEKLKERHPTYGTVNIKFLAKGLAGLYAVVAEASDIPLADVVVALRATLEEED